MPTYVFKDAETGEKIDRYFPIAEAPRFGETIIVDGREYVRQLNFNLDSAGIARKTHKYPYLSRSLPRDLNGCECNSKGQPIIKSQAHERNVAAEHDMAKE